jgi:hypothetical protein
LAFTTIDLTENTSDYYAGMAGFKTHEQRKKAAENKLRLFDDLRGVQIRKIRMIRKDRPEWATSVPKIRAKLLRPAIRRVQIAYLYWGCGLSAREISEDLRMTQKAVEKIIERLRDV